jgi:hypothetical protein
MSEEGVAVEATESWHSGLSDEYRGNESLSQIPDLNTLAKSYLDAQQYAGGSIRIPGEDASTDDWSAFNAKLTDKVPTLLNLPSDENEARDAMYSRLGRPDTKDGYKVDGADPEFLDWAHKNGLSTAQVKSWQENTQGKSTQEGEDYDTQMNEANDLLKKEWGHAYDTKLSQAKNAVLAYADSETQQFLLDSGLANNPGMIRLMAGIGATLSEDQSAGIESGSRFTLSPSEALDRIGEVRRNTEHPYNINNHPQHKAEVEKMGRLYSQAYPEEV